MTINKKGRLLFAVRYLSGDCPRHLITDKRCQEVGDLFGVEDWRAIKREAKQFGRVIRRAEQRLRNR